jgi:hypothetical protein
MQLNMEMVIVVIFVAIAPDTDAILMPLLLL